MLVNSRRTTLITDPWLVGSTYWRSWWNCPKACDAWRVAVTADCASASDDRLRVPEPLVGGAVSVLCARRRSGRAEVSPQRRFPEGVRGHRTSDARPVCRPLRQ